MSFQIKVKNALLVGDRRKSSERGSNLRAVVPILVKAPREAGGLRSYPGSPQSLLAGIAGFQEAKTLYFFPFFLEV